MILISKPAFSTLHITNILII